MHGGETDKLLREKNVEFFGAITASLSHEINNVYTIINELGGLLGDHMIMAEKGKPVDTARLKGVSEKIAGQVQRGKEIVRQLNRFAHSVDHPVALVSLREVLGRLIAASNRLAAMKKAELAGDFEGEDIEITVSPFGLQQAVFRCVKMAIDSVDSGKKIAVRYEAAEPGALVIVESADPISRTDEVKAEIDFLALLMKELGGGIECVPETGDISSFKLSFPPSPPKEGS